MRATHPAPRSILLVDDDRSNHELALRAFEEARLHIPLYWCGSGQDALDFLRANESKTKCPSLILMDIYMPGLDGYQTLEQIKEDSHLKQIPVIMLSTSGNECDVKSCYELGASSYVQKPMEFGKMVKIAKAIKSYWFETALLPH
jgi:CheY-like chemotaxis protein